MVDPFEQYIHEITISLRIFAGEPRRFFDTIKALRGDYKYNDETPELIGIAGYLSRSSVTVLRADSRGSKALGGQELFVQSWRYGIRWHRRSFWLINLTRNSPWIKFLGILSQGTCPDICGGG